LQEGYFVNPFPELSPAQKHWRATFVELVKVALICARYCEQYPRQSIPPELLQRLTQTAMQLHTCEESMTVEEISSMLPRGLWEQRVYRAAQSWALPPDPNRTADKNVTNTDSRRLAALKAVIQARLS
jgi:hypothetical protein